MYRPRKRARGMTLLEIMVSISVLAMMALLIYGAFQSLFRGKKSEAARSDRAHQGRDAVLRIARELQTAFLSLHNPQQQSLITRLTAFIGSGGSRSDRVDFASFSHKRYTRDVHESDQCEVGFFTARNPEDPQKLDLVRREQTPIDMDPKKGGVISLLAEDIESFHVRYLDPVTGQWLDSWDSTQQSGQFARLPIEVKIELVLHGAAPNAPPYTYRTKVFLPIQQPLSFGVPRQ